MTKFSIPFCARCTEIRIAPVDSHSHRCVYNKRKVQWGRLSSNIGDNRAVNRESVIPRSRQWEFEVEVSRLQRDSTFSSMGI